MPCAHRLDTIRVCSFCQCLAALLRGLPPRQVCLQGLRILSGALRSAVAIWLQRVVVSVLGVAPRVEGTIPGNIPVATFR